MLSSLSQPWQLGQVSGVFTTSTAEGPARGTGQSRDSLDDADVANQAKQQDAEAGDANAQWEALLQGQLEVCKVKGSRELEAHPVPCAVRLHSLSSPETLGDLAADSPPTCLPNSPPYTPRPYHALASPTLIQGQITTA